jgi:hypothetical protein
VKWSVIVLKVKMYQNFKSRRPILKNGHLFLSIFEKRPQELKKRNIIAFGRARGVGIPFILFLKAFHVIFKYKTL